jgi:uncharacterized damage-inducible protein DinB
MRPDQAEFLLQFLLPQLRSEQAIMKKIMDAVPPDKSDYKPDARSRSALRLAWHIAAAEMWLLDAVIHRQFGEFASLPADLSACRDVAQWYEENTAQRVRLLETLDGEHLTAPVDFIGLRNDPAVAYLNIAIRHSVHHRGQLSTYLRAMGAKVPAIYVESADEPYPPAPGSPATEASKQPPAF